MKNRAAPRISRKRDFIGGEKEGAIDTHEGTGGFIIQGQSKERVCAIIGSSLWTV
jgi:hypothetical protein